MCHNYLGGMYLRTFSKKPAPDTVPSVVILSKNVPLSKQTDAILGYIFQFSIFINVPLSISYTSSHKIFISSVL